MQAIHPFIRPSIRIEGLFALASSLLFLLAPLSAPADAPAPDQTAIDAAIDKGTAYLLGRMKAPPNLQYKWMPDRAAPEFYEEFVLYTLAHAGIGTDNPVFLQLLDRTLKKEMKKTYHVACMAMALETLDRKAYQRRIAQCAQFLIDNQMQEGGWGYGEPTKLPVVTLSPVRKKTVTQSGGKPSSLSSPKRDDKGMTVALPKLGVQRQRWGKGPPDNSNTQIALLGLRACVMASIQMPPDVFPLADKYWRDQMQGDGWGYRKSEGGAWGSMTAGGLSCLAICDFYTPGKSAADDADIRKATGWMTSRWTWDKCPDQPRGEWQYYYIYGVERCGMLLNTETFGDHNWYNEGAKYLIEKQRPGGDWEGSNSDPVADTCFAILFLKRATKPLQKVYTQ